MITGYVNKNLFLEEVMTLQKKFTFFIQCDKNVHNKIWELILFEMNQIFLKECTKVFKNHKSS